MNVIETVDGYVLLDHKEITSEKTDNRRRKQYARSISFKALRVVLPSREARFPGSRINDLMPEWVAEHLDSLTLPENWRVYPGKRFVSADFHSPGDKAFARDLLINVEVRVDFPRNIPEDREILVKLGGGKFFQDLLKNAFLTALGEDTQRRGARVRANQATNLVNHLARELTRKAKEACRVEQRVAGLLAEFRAEKEAQAKRAIYEIQTGGIQLAGEEALDARVIKAVIDNLGRAMEGRGESFGMPFGPDPIRIDPED
jgi:hypothetical protein